MVKRKFKIGDKVVVRKDSQFAKHQRHTSDGGLMMQVIKTVDNRSMPYKTANYWYYENDLEFYNNNNNNPTYQVW